MHSTVDPREIENFAKSSPHWWDENGPHAPLHKLNPTRITYIRDQIATHFGKDPHADKPLSDISILDVGCGGGLLCEPLSRLGAKVTGLDADANAIKVAKEHAQSQELDIAYLNSSIEEMGAQKFDAILIVEIVEHVADLPSFINACMKHLNKNGILVFSTFNRTSLSYLMGIVVAEKIMRWVPDGTHEWDKFVKPAEFSELVETNNFKIRNLQGMTYSPLNDTFKLTQDLSVNYIGVATAA